MYEFAVVFDMDGVIFDTERLIQECWQEVADYYGIPDIKSTCTKCAGLNLQAATEVFLEKYGKEFPYFEYRAEARGLFWGKRYGKCFPIKPGAEEILKWLKERNIPVALASSTASVQVHKALQDAGLLKYFDEIVCGDLVTNSKPHPEIFLKACELLRVDPGNTFAIEDSANGMQAAYRGGLMPIMVPDLIAPTKDLEEMAVCVCDSLWGVMEYFINLENMSKI